MDEFDSLHPGGAGYQVVRGIDHHLDGEQLGKGELEDA